MFLNQIKIIFFVSLFSLCYVVAGFCENAVLYGYLIKSEKGTFITGKDSQFFTKFDNGCELRMMYSSEIEVSDKFDVFTILDGNIGIKTATESVKILTQNLSIYCSPNSIVVVKRIDGFDRVCVIKGAVSVYHKKSDKSSEVTSDNEVAASSDFLSNFYKRSDDLRFMWYWSHPDKEPSLQK